MSATISPSTLSSSGLSAQTHLQLLLFGPAEHTPVSGSCTSSACRHPRGSSQAFIHLYLRDIPLNSPSKRSVPSHPPNYSGSLYPASFLATLIDLQHNTKPACSLSTPPLCGSFMRAGTWIC